VSQERRRKRWNGKTSSHFLLHFQSPSFLVEEKGKSLHSLVRRKKREVG
jgi:hypothetical protein